jgi:hypothetical protein
MAKERLIRIAFFGYESFAWTGGLNYIKNLLHGLKLQNNLTIEPIIFVSRLAEQKALDLLSPYAKIIKTPSKDPLELLFKILDKVTSSSFFHLNYILKKNKIDIVSHSNKAGISKKFKVINWIPDFQHVHLPAFFSDIENETRDKTFRSKIEQADCVVISSYDAKEDYDKFAPAQINKGKVLQFVSDIDQSIYTLSQNDFERILLKYKIPNKFFYLPNQFWKHKNHIIVIEALNKLKKQGIEISVVCTGNMQTEEVKGNVAHLNSLIEAYGLKNNMIFLGLVNYQEVQTLLRYSVSVLNPSLFEGWSSTVEECKSLGKNMIVSNINVHKEQNPPNSLYFDPLNDEELVNLLKLNWETMSAGPDLELEQVSKTNLSFRLKEFGENYAKLVQEAIN